MAACVLPEGPARYDGLPGLPIVAPGEAEGPIHRQVLLEFENETVILLETLEGDGRIPRAFRTRVDRHGEILERTALDPDAPELEATDSPSPLPHRLGSFRLETQPVDGRIEVWLFESTEEGASVRLGTLPRARATDVRGVLVPPTGHETLPPLAAVAWESAEGSARVAGLLVLDLRAGQATLHQRRGLTAHRGGDHAAAARHFQAAWTVDPSDPLGAYNLACALTALGQHERALSYLDRAVALDSMRIRVFAAQDPDLDPLRRHPVFARIVGPGFDHRPFRRASD